MKKLISAVLLVMLALSLAACDFNNGPTEEELLAKSEGVMTYEEYAAAPLDSEVVVEAYVQATQSWWDDKITVYAADPAGAYFFYEMACSEADAAKLTAGTKIKVSGVKGAWKGEVEVMEATFEFCDDGLTYVAEAKDLTSVLGTEALINYQNQLVIFKNMTVKSIAYKGDARGDDIYLTLTKGGVDYEFCVEVYLTGSDTDVYRAVEALTPGKVIDVECFLYWYDAPNAHVTTVTVKGDINAKSEGVMTYAQYAAAELESEVVVEAYVQATQSWWDDKITVYAADPAGAYFFYEMACSEADAAKLIPGTKIKVTGYKTAWKGEVEIASGATFEFANDGLTYVAGAEDLTDKLGTEALINNQNKLAKFTDMTVKSVTYKGDARGDDIYVTLTKNGVDYDFCVERYLTDPDTEVYKAVEALKAGDVIDVEAFLYWYDGPNPHVTAVTKK